MAEHFDPYHIWLGIPSEEQPPNCYRLLGIRLFEDRPEVIEHAADQRMAHLKSLAAGPHAQRVQRLLNEVAAARIRLLDAYKKSMYDERLRQAGGQASPPAGTLAGKQPVPPGEAPTATYAALGELGEYRLLEKLGEGGMGAVYMAPEQISDSRSADIRADIYALGCTLYKLLTGRAPFSGPKYQTMAQKVAGHLQHRVPPIRQLRGDVPAELAKLLDRMLAKDPAKRPGTPAEVADTERFVWARLRSRRFAGYKFRRQMPIGSYIVDFVCLERRMILELDGGQHSQQVERDAQRTLWLQSQGFEVLRFWDHEVLQ